MDNFTQIANKILSESIQNEYMSFDDIYKQPGATDLRDEMLGLNDKIFDAIDRKDKEAHLAALQEYEDLRDEALAKFGLDGPVGLIDPDMHGEYSDDFKDENGVRPRSDALNTFRNVVEFYADGRNGKIVGDQYVAPEIQSYIDSEDTRSSTEDNESSIRSLDGFFSDKKPAIEDAEQSIDSVARTATALLSIPDQGKGRFIPGSIAGKVQKAKKELADKLVDAAKSINI